MNEASSNIETMTVTAKQVRDYLANHPNFLREHPELLEVLLPPEVDMGRNVLDFQQFAITALQRKVQDTQEHYSTVVNVARDNHRIQRQVHDASLKLMSALTLEQLFEYLCVDFPVIFDVDVVRLSLESEMGGHFESYYPEQHYSGLTLIEMGSCDVLFSSGSNVYLIENSLETHHWLTEKVFHECQDLAKSIVYMGLTLRQSGRRALLAFGVRNEGRFQAGQGTELLQYLAQVAELKLDYMLHDQAGLL